MLFLSVVKSRKVIRISLMIIRDFSEKKQTNEIAFKQIYFYFQINNEILKLLRIVAYSFKPYRNFRRQRSVWQWDLDEYFFED